MNFTEKVYKGFIETKGKKPIGTYTKKSSLIVDYEKALKYNEFNGILKENIVLIDVDNETEGKKLLEIIEALEIDTPIFKTNRGYHFIFEDVEGLYTKTITKNISPIGLTIDTKLGKNNGMQCLKFNGELRQIIKDTDNIASLPCFLWIKEGATFKKISDILYTGAYGERNDFINSHSWHLQKEGYNYDEVVEICSIINDFIFYEPLEEKEFKNATRKQDINNNNSYSNNKHSKKVTRDMFFIENKNGRLIFQHNLLGEYLASLYHPTIIDNVLYIYDKKEGIYTKGKNTVNKTIYELIPDLKINQKREVLEVLKTLADIKQINHRYRAVNNGLLDTKEMRLIDFTPDIVTVNKIPTNYNENVDLTKVTNILNSFVKNDSYHFNLLCQMFGSVFIENKNIYGKMFIIRGNQNNGKSMLLQYGTNVFGAENIANVDLANLGDRFTTITLRNKLFNLGDDIKSSYIEETSILKNAVTGGSVFVESKGEQGETMVFNIVMVFTANTLPKIKDTTGAVARRLVLIELNNDFSPGSPARDPDIINKINDVEAKEGLLYLAFQGYKDILKNGGIKMSKELEEMLQEYDLENNPIKAFNKEMEDEHGKNWYIGETVNKVYSHYENWAFNNGHIKIHSQPTFTKEFKAINGVETVQKKINGINTRIFNDGK